VADNRSRDPRAGVEASPPGRPHGQRVAGKLTFETVQICEAQIETEGGEALAVAAVEILGVNAKAAVLAAGAGSASSVSSAPWHVLWTHSHCEQMVYDQLSVRSFHPFLPKVDVWSVRAGRRRLINAPMFPGYLFLNDALDKRRHIDVCKARGLARILGEGWERLAVVPEAEIAAIRQLTASRVPVFAHPYLREGRRVRIVSGPLAEVEGILVRARPEKGLLVLSVHILQRSVAVEVDGAQVVAA
jgi:transcriptional antiterminator NusG